MTTYDNKMCIYPFINGNMFLTLSDWHVSSDYPLKGYNDMINPINCNKIKDGDIVFVKRSEIDLFFREIINKIHVKFKLISHNGDNPITNEYNKYLTENLIEWWCVNNCSTNKKIKSLPIGIQNKNLYFDGNPQGDDKILKEIIKTEITKDKDILLTFNIKTNPSHRVGVYNHFLNKPFTTERKYSNIDRKNGDFIKNYLKDVKRHKFVLCPWGNGYDCHRNWEVMYLGSIPIIQKHPSLDYYEDLPVWLIDNWSEVTKENLENKYLEIIDKSYDLNKLYINHWEEKIREWV